LKRDTVVRNCFLWEEGSLENVVAFLSSLDDDEDVVQSVKKVDYDYRMEWIRALQERARTRLTLHLLDSKYWKVD
jgi:hypothetical protein